MVGNLVGSFLSYLLLLVIVVVVGAVAVTLGITLRKKKNARTEAEEINREAE
ncbi:MAG: hypothetical protein NC081_11015 [Roseburia sp.]|nr:hypothetical protein [Roseburia sp.]